MVELLCGKGRRLTKPPTLCSSSGSFLAPTLQRHVPAKSGRALIKHLIFYPPEGLLRAKIEVFVYHGEHC